MSLPKRLSFRLSVLHSFRLPLTFRTLVSDGKILTGFPLAERSHSKMAKRIYVGGLPYSATDEELEKLFSASGTVTSANVITDKYTGQAKGFGFVEMSTDAEADAAIAALNGTLMGGRNLTVNEAKPREERPRDGGGYGGGGSRGGGGGYGGRGGRNRWEVPA